MRGAARRSRGEGAFGAIVGIALLVLVGYALIKIVPLHIAGSQILDAMNEGANFGSLKPFDKIAYEISVKAEENGVSLPPKEIKISRNGESIVIEAKYSKTVNVLGYNYVYNFDKRVEKPVF